MDIFSLCPCPHPGPWWWGFFPPPRHKVLCPRRVNRHTSSCGEAAESGCLCLERPLRRGWGHLAHGELLDTGEMRGEIPGRHFHLRLRILAAGEITLLEWKQWKITHPVTARVFSLTVRTHFPQVTRTAVTSGRDKIVRHVSVTQEPPVKGIWGGSGCEGALQGGAWANTEPNRCARRRARAAPGRPTLGIAGAKLWFSTSRRAGRAAVQFRPPRVTVSFGETEEIFARNRWAVFARAAALVSKS